TATLSLVAVLLNTVAAETFFDPSKDFKKCGLDKPSMLCDAESVLTKAERARIDNELRVFEPRTSLRKRGEKKGNCSLSGITPGIYLVQNGDEERIEALTDFAKQNWTVDTACKNEMIIVLSANDTQYHVYRSPDAPHQTALEPYDVAHYVNREVDNLTKGKTAAALSNILHKAMARAAAKYPVYKKSTFPNPMMGEHVKCGLKSASPLCDPDSIFDEEEKGIIVKNLAMFEELTKNSPASPTKNVSSFCRERGYSMGLAVMRRVEGGSKTKLTDLAHHLLNTWKLDEKCGKHFIIAIAIDDGYYVVVAPSESLLRMDKFTKYFEDSGAFFLRAEVRLALRDIFSSAAEDAHSGALFSLFNRRRRAVAR
ncbi:hypothetical protein PFISCL1PPCAC_25763, partial [Pristionchus fissidentatus]